VENNIPETEGIKYAGSKLKILPYILQEVKSLPDVKHILDGFSGTTRVSQALYKSGYDVTCNDISYWSETFGKCYLQADKPATYYQPIIDHLNALEGKLGWFSEHYGAQDLNNGKYPFQLHNTMKLDAIREEIENLNLSEIDKQVLLTSLILALDKVDNSLGHQVSYLSKWSARSYHTLELKVPLITYPKLGKTEVMRGDIMETIKNKSFDLAYLDPPYGSNNNKMPSSRVRYSSYYHLWTTIIKNDHPKLFGKAQRREDTRDLVSTSAFEDYKKDENGKLNALNELERLIHIIHANYILLSYSSGGIISKNELIEILQKNGTLIHSQEIDYKKNVMANMKWTNEWSAKSSSNQEYLFLLKK
jgi:adenine-specific DNA-methyltransferase